MRIGIIGTGKMATALGGLLVRAGHELFIGSRVAGKGAAQAEVLGSGAVGGGIREAASFSDTVVLAVPFVAAREAIQAAGPLTGKVLIDITNPLTPDFMALTIGHTTSAGETIATLAPEAKVVKAFNHLLAPTLKGGLWAQAASKPAAFLCGDDEPAKAKVSELVRSLGFEPLNAGPLKNARYLEPAAELLIQLAYGQGLGPEIALALVRR
ncbi:MAG TPA: NADPH-dependent F420 reductase [Polyangia bacterium]